MSVDVVSPKAGLAADILIRIGLEAELFHAPDSTAFADVEVNGHRLMLLQSHLRSGA